MCDRNRGRPGLHCDRVPGLRCHHRDWLSRRQRRRQAGLLRVLKGRLVVRPNRRVALLPGDVRRHRARELQLTNARRGPSQDAIRSAPCRDCSSIDLDCMSHLTYY